MPPAVAPAIPAILPTLLPALLSAGGALFGVILTLTIQAILATKQRRQERQGRAFDARFELYAEFLALVDELPNLRRDAQAHLDRQQRLLDATNELKAAGEDLAAITSRLPESGDISSLPEDEVRQLRLTAPKALEHHRSAKEDFEKARTELGRKDDASQKITKRLEDALGQLYKIRQQMKILSDLKTMAAAVVLFERIAAREQPSAKEEAAFREASRRELGLK